MKKMLKILVAVALPMALVSGSVADAAPAAPAKAPAKAGVAAQKGGPKAKGGKRQTWGFVKALVKAGALPASALKELTDHQAKIGACFKAARAAKKVGRVECRTVRIGLVELQNKIYGQAKPKDAKQIAKVGKFKAWLGKRLTRIKTNLAKKKAAPVKAPIKK